MAWPYALAYADPAMAATVFAATVGLPHVPYHGNPNLPATAHLAPSSSSYPSAAAAYYSRYAPYPSISPATALHRPHPRGVPYPPLPPHLLQSQPPLTPLPFGLGVPSINSTAYPPGGHPPPTTGAPYQPAMLPQQSPTNSNSDESVSDCEYIGRAQQVSQSIHRVTLPHQNSHRMSVPTTHVTTPQPVNNIIPSVPMSISNILESRATVYSMTTSSTSMTTSSISTSRVEQPKLFQPYKSDVTERGTECAK